MRKKSISIVFLVIGIVCVIAGIFLISNASSLGYNHALAIREAQSLGRSRFDMLIAPSIRNYQLAGAFLSSAGSIFAAISLFALSVQKTRSKESEETLAALRRLEHIVAATTPAVDRKEKRGAAFWQGLQEECVAIQEEMTEELIPVLSEVGLLSFNGRAIQVGTDEETPLRSLYPVIEMGLFPCATFAAALRELVPNFSKEDEQNLKKFIFSTANEKVTVLDQIEGNYTQILTDRLSEYSRACEKDLIAGYSLYGYFNTGFEGIEEWSQDSRKKCALLLVDHIMYIKHLGDICTYEALDKLIPFVENNRDETMNVFRAIYNNFLNVSESIFTTVQDALDDNK